MSTPSENTVPVNNDTVSSLDLGYWDEFMELIADRDDSSLGDWIENDLRELEEDLSDFVSPKSLQKYR